MQEPAWKRLVDELRDRKFESPYLDRLRARLPAGGAKEDLAAEILREMASALGRAEDKVNVALLELDVMGRRIDGLGPGPARDREIAAFNDKRKVAQQVLWELRVHREAVGFVRNQDLATYYPIPPARR